MSELFATTTNIINSGFDVYMNEQQNYMHDYNSRKVIFRLVFKAKT